MDESTSWILLNKLLVAEVRVDVMPINESQCTVSLSRGKHQAKDHGMSACSALWASYEAATAAGWLEDVWSREDMQHVPPEVEP